MAELHEYKCPCCGGSIEFNSSVQKLKCPYCDTEYDVDTIKNLDDELSGINASDVKWDMGGTTEWSNSDVKGMRVFVCKSCAGEIIGDENMAATKCPYCGNNVIVMGNFAGGLKPDLVIPFKLDKQAAIKAMSNHLKGKKLLPKVFKDENHIEEILGVYVPFWLFNTDVSATANFTGKRIRHWSDSNYSYTETSYYSLVRAGNLTFENVPTDASRKMDDALMDSIEPYNYSEAVDFNTAYMAGFFADKYDVTAEESSDRANERIHSTSMQILRDTVHGYSGVTTHSNSIRYNNSKAKYALLPVWILNTKWNDTNYTFAMNGQTGKFVGNLPMDKSLKNKYFFKFFGIASFVTLAVSLLISFFA